MKLYKYRVVNEYTLNSIREQYIWMSNPSTFNDTFDCKRIFDYYGKDIDKNITVFCMSDSFKNHLLWGYYADGYRGICIEYDLPNRFPFCFENLSYPFFPVCKPIRYVTDMPFFENRPPHMLTLREKQALLDSYIFTKNAEWSHEKEWRFAMFFEKLKQKSNICKLPPNTISAIYFGCDLSEKDKINIHKAIRHIENIKLYQIEKKYNSFDIDARPLPQPRPWTWKYLTEREKELARSIDNYLIDSKNMIETGYNKSIEDLMIEVGANPNEYDFVVDRVGVNKRLIKVWNNSTESMTQAQEILKKLE